MIDLKIQHYFSGREYAKQMVLPAGFYADTHTHNYDHLSVLAHGIVKVLIGDEELVHTGPTCLVIPANAVHRIEAITDSVWFCIHATDETDPEKVDSVLIKEG